MRRPAFTEERITFALKQVEMGVSAAECCRKILASRRCRLKMLEKKNREPKQLVVDLRLDKVMLQDALQREL